MKHGLLLRTLAVKEMKMLVRDRQQFFALVGVILSMAFLLVPLSRAADGASKSIEEMVANFTRQAQPGESTQPPQSNDKSIREFVTIIRWVFVAVGATVSFYGSLFAINMALAAFVGDKELRTMELLLCAPIKDGTLYTFKCLSVLLPGWLAAYGVLLVGGASLMLLVHHWLVKLPADVLWQSVLLALPLPLMVTGIQVGLCVIASVRAQTLKGAGQFFGLLIIMIGVGGALLIFGALASPWGDNIKQTAIAWLTLPFAVQYLIVIGVLTLMWVALWMIGRSLFNREKLVT